MFWRDQELVVKFRENIVFSKPGFGSGRILDHLLDLDAESIVQLKVIAKDRGDWCGADAHPRAQAGGGIYRIRCLPWRNRRVALVFRM